MPRSGDLHYTGSSELLAVVQSTNVGRDRVAHSGEYNSSAFTNVEVESSTITQLHRIPAFNPL